jgi:hypothetical protein
MIQKERKDDNTNHVNSNLNVNNNSKLEPLSDDMQGIHEGDGAVGVQQRAEIAASIVGDRAAKVLKALQVHIVEMYCCIHIHISIHVYFLYVYIYIFTYGFML